MHKSGKETKGGIHDPILTHPVCGHHRGGPRGGGCGGGFSFGWTDFGAKKKIDFFLSRLTLPRSGEMAKLFKESTPVAP